MACTSKGHVTPALTKTGNGHREIKAVQGNAVIHEIMKMPQQGAGPRLALEFVQSFGVNPVGHERRTNAMARHVTHDEFQIFVAFRKNHAEVTADSLRGAVIGL